MAIPYSPEQKPVEKNDFQISDMQDLDEKIARSEPFKDRSADFTSQADNIALKKEMPLLSLDPALEADAKIAQTDHNITALEITGNPEHDKQYTHRQGENSYGFQGTCGLVSCEGVLRKFGVNVTENDIVDHAVKKKECYTDGTPEKNGGTSPADQAQILTDYGVSARVESGGDIEKLAQQVREGRGVILEANAGELWNDANYYDNGNPNHAIVVTGFERDTSANRITGFYINDSGAGQAGRFVDVDTMKRAWVDTGGLSVVTDAAHS